MTKLLHSKLVLGQIDLPASHFLLRHGRKKGERRDLKEEKKNKQNQNATHPPTSMINPEHLFTTLDFN